jgi:hypothetical protein
VAEEDGFLEIEFHADPDERVVVVHFKEIKGWRVEHGCLRLFYETYNVSWPLDTIREIKVVYNSPEVQNQILRTDSWHCPKCGGEIHG